jgi:hypothetical protein
VNGFENIEAAFRQGLDEEGFVEGRTASVGGLVVFREFRDDDRTGPDHDSSLGRPPCLIPRYNANEDGKFHLPQCDAGRGAQQLCVSLAPMVALG